MPSKASSLRPQWATITQADFRNNIKQLLSLNDLAEFWEIAPYQLSYYAFHIE